MSTGADYLIGEIKAEIAKEEVAFHQRPAADFGDYMKRVGKCQGLQHSLDILEKILSDTDKEN